MHPNHPSKTPSVNPNLLFRTLTHWLILRSFKKLNLHHLSSGHPTPKKINDSSDLPPIQLKVTTRINNIHFSGESLEKTLENSTVTGFHWVSSRCSKSELERFHCYQVGGEADPSDSQCPWIVGSFGFLFGFAFGCTKRPFFQRRWWPPASLLLWWPQGAKFIYV